MYFQQWVERTCFEAGGGQFVAPAQRIDDFIRQKLSVNLPDCSYQPGIKAINLWDVLPGFVAESLQGGLQAFGKKIKAYASNEGVMVATESRTSSPVRIPRHPESLEHIQVGGLYPCAEGAGYAGGIVSAAMDGERVAASIAASVGIGF